MTHWKWIVDLQCSAAATRSVLLEIARLPDVPEPIKKIMLSYEDFYDQEREKLLLEFEKKHPGLAAELDSDTSPPPP